MLRYLSPWLTTTNRCNCKCAYCFVDKNIIDMDQETYNSINKYFLQLIKNDRIDGCTYRMAGGEPLLVIKDWYDFAKEFCSYDNKKCRIETITNFTLFPQELIELLNLENFNISISLDSISYSKPFNDGISSHNKVISNIDIYKKQYNKKPYILTVLTENGKYLPELAQYIIDIGAGWKISTNKFFESNFNTDEVNKNINKVLFIFDKNKYPITKLDFNFCKVNTPAKTGCNNGKSIFAIDQYGNFTNCQMDSMALGNIKQDDVISILKNNSTCFSACSKCKTCSIVDFCHGNCPKCKQPAENGYLCNVTKNFVFNALILYKNQLKEGIYAQL